MRIEEIAITLRPRPMAEAADLGVALVRRHAASVWRSFAPLYAGVVLLALGAAWLAPWLPSALIFFLKPWLDRSLLFILARAVFGQKTRWADLWRQRGAVGGGQLLRTLLARRLSPWRAYTLPIEQLEGQRGAARRKRRGLLLRGQHGGALALQFAFSATEAVLIISLWAMLLWFMPGLEIREVIAWQNSDALPAVLASAACYALVVGVLEPFYVGAGFAMYLNRRVELEAWDIEQEFRHAFAA